MARRYRSADHILNGDARPTLLQMRIEHAVTNGLGYDPAPHGDAADEHTTMQDHLCLLDMIVRQRDFPARIKQLIQRVETSEADYLTLEERRQRLRDIRRLYFLINPNDR